jgi:hypothetical protein
VAGLGGCVGEQHPVARPGSGRRQSAAAHR